MWRLDPLPLFAARGQSEQDPRDKYVTFLSTAKDVSLAMYFYRMRANPKIILLEELEGKDVSYLAHDYGKAAEFIIVPKRLAYTTEVKIGARKVVLGHTLYVAEATQTPKATKRAALSPQSISSFDSYLKEIAKTVVFVNDLPQEKGKEYLKFNTEQEKATFLKTATENGLRESQDLKTGGDFRDVKSPDVYVIEVHPQIKEKIIQFQELVEKKRSPRP